MLSLSFFLSFSYTLSLILFLIGTCSVSFILVYSYYLSPSWSIPSLSSPFLITFFSLSLVYSYNGSLYVVVYGTIDSRKYLLSLSLFSLLSILYFSFSPTVVYSLKKSIPYLFFLFFFSSSNTVNERSIENLPMTGFEPHTSGVGSDFYKNWATTTAQSLLFILTLCPYFTQTLSLTFSIFLIIRFLLFIYSHGISLFSDSIYIHIYSVETAAAGASASTGGRCLNRMKHPPYISLSSKTWIKTFLDVLFCKNADDDHK